MNTKERILSLRVLEAVNKNPDYKKQLKVEAKMNHIESNKEASYAERIC